MIELTPQELAFVKWLMEDLKLVDFIKENADQVDGAFSFIKKINSF